MASTAYAKCEILRVSYQNPCPICDKPDWCGVFDDGHAAICMRVESDHPTQNGGWLHIISDSSTPYRPIITTPKEIKRANPDTLNTVYHDIFDPLRLSNHHRNDLMARGLEPEEVRTLRGMEGGVAALHP